MDALTSWERGIIERLEDSERQIIRQQDALIMRTQILTAKSQENWNRLAEQMERRCERLNRGPGRSKFVFESVSVFQFRVRLNGLATAVNVVFTPALHKWIADDGRGNPYTVETRLDTRNDPRMFEVTESDESGEPEYTACAMSQVTEHIAEMAAGL